MDSFSWGKAWSLGYRLVASRTLAHAIVLVGIGILIPFAAQYAVIGVPPERPNSMLIGEGARAAAPGLGWAFVTLMAAGYVLQSGSYFTSWRLGFDGSASLGRALGYGLLSGMLAVAIVAAIGLLILGTVELVGTEGAAILLVIALFLPLLAAFATFYTLVASVAAVAVALLLTLMMIMGAATGQVEMAATMVGGSGVVAVVILILCGITLWLAARLCCATALMAERKSFNLIAAVIASWDLTWEEQWSIMRYLAVIGLGLALLLIGIGAAVGVSTGAMTGPLNGTAATTGFALVGVAASIPAAFLTVMIPAGIYRALNPPVIDAEVFA